MPFDEFLSFSRDISHGTGGDANFGWFKKILVDDLSKERKKKI